MDDGDGDTDLISFGQEKSEFTTPWICSCTALISTQALRVQATWLKWSNAARN